MVDIVPTDSTAKRKGNQSSEHAMKQATGAEKKTGDVCASQANTILVTINQMDFNKLKGKSISLSLTQSVRLPIYVIT